ncbi:PIG-L family deacetylase [Pseudonocardia sp. RS11V-5]|uniref:PIG-L family deacetylase n=1 Tax=Pseudonocardia terrae TaxID=2905831 RepID=UPI001E65621F|nr:PIG-L family deacetylase [Pseudonocardia terrae]MCE3550360.1 PIG-L family deacetylase [Pseudonocardia terrae]
MTTLSLVAHQDDDLLFMNPDVVSDVQAGEPTWIMYLTAGNLDPGPAGMPYANKRIQGARAAWERGAQVANPSWTFRLLLVDGRTLPSNRLDGTNLNLVFTFVNAANAAVNDPVGDLGRMWSDPTFTTQPIDGRSSYNHAQFVEMLRGLIAYVGPDFLRVQDPAGEEMGGHVDHANGARLAMEANSLDGVVSHRADTYFDYIDAQMPENFDGYWRNEKQAMWNAYKPFDSEVGPTTWDVLAGREHRRRIYWPGDRWSPDL